MQINIRLFFPNDVLTELADLSIFEKNAITFIDSHTVKLE